MATSTNDDDHRCKHTRRNENENLEAQPQQYSSNCARNKKDSHLPLGTHFTIIDRLRPLTRLTLALFMTLAKRSSIDGIRALRKPMAVERPIEALNTQLWAKSRVAVGRNLDAAERRPRVEMFEAGFPSLCRNTRPLPAVVSRGWSDRRQSAHA